MILLISLIITKTRHCFLSCVENYNNLIKILTVLQCWLHSLWRLDKPPKWLMSNSIIKKTSHFFQGQNYMWLKDDCFQGRIPCTFLPINPICHSSSVTISLFGKGRKYLIFSAERLCLLFQRSTRIIAFMSTSEHPNGLNMIQPPYFYIKYQMSWRVIVLQKAEDCQCGCFSN